jgi:outer membrane protein OmpA-like peptidoglycan-associated protein
MVLLQSRITARKAVHNERRLLVSMAEHWHVPSRRARRQTMARFGASFIRRLADVDRPPYPQASRAFEEPDRTRTMGEVTGGRCNNHACPQRLPARSCRAKTKGPAKMTSPVRPSTFAPGASRRLFIVHTVTFAVMLTWILGAFEMRDTQVATPFIAVSMASALLLGLKGAIVKPDELWVGVVQTLRAPVNWASVDWSRSLTGTVAVISVTTFAWWMGPNAVFTRIVRCPEDVTATLENTPLKCGERFSHWIAPKQPPPVVKCAFKDPAKAREEWLAIDDGDNGLLCQAEVQPPAAVTANSRPPTPSQPAASEQAPAEPKPEESDDIPEDPTSDDTADDADLPNDPSSAPDLTIDPPISVVTLHGVVFNLPAEQGLGSGGPCHDTKEGSPASDWYELDDNRGAYCLKSRLDVPGLLQFDSRAESPTPGPNREYVLQQVTLFLKSNPQVTKLRIEGHTNNVGEPQQSMVLSRQRAQAVADLLVSRGIEVNRLCTLGWGQERPIANNAYLKGRVANSRVEFYVQDVNGKPVDDWNYTQ